MKRRYISLTQKPTDTIYMITMSRPGIVNNTLFYRISETMFFLCVKQIELFSIQPDTDDIGVCAKLRLHMQKQ
jgi:hypothetical protein